MLAVAERHLCAKHESIALETPPTSLVGAPSTARRSQDAR